MEISRYTTVFRKSYVCIYDPKRGYLAKNWKIGGSCSIMYEKLREQAAPPGYRANVCKQARDTKSARKPRNRESLHEV